MLSVHKRAPHEAHVLLHIQFENVKTENIVFVSNRMKNNELNQHKRLFRRIRVQSGGLLQVALTFKQTMNIL